MNEVNKVSAFCNNCFHILLYLVVCSPPKITIFMKDFVIEALRSIAELVTYGDQNDPSFFE